MGHAVRLLLAQTDQFGGVLEADEFYFGGRTKSNPDQPPPGRGRKGLPRTTKKPALGMVERPVSREPGASARLAGAEVVKPPLLNEIERVKLLDRDICVE